MHNVDIERLLRQPEGQFLERKSCYGYVKGQWKQRKPRDIARDVAETLSAYANADGGTLLLGVDADGDVSGFNFPEDKIKLIKNAPKNLIKPPLRVDIHNTSMSGKQILLFTANWVPDVYQLTDGRIEMTATWDDISQDLVLEFAEKLGINKSPEDILLGYRLMEYDNGDSRFKLAALLLFGKDPLRWHPWCGIDFIKYEGTEKKVGRELNIIKRARIELPLVRLIEEAYRTITAHIKERQYLHDLFFVEKLEYPAFAWQEAIVNAVAHRDYSIQGISTEIWMFDNRIEIRSPGLPPEPVTLQKILKRERVHASRNPLKDYQKVCGVDLYTASKDIKDMINKRIIELPKKRGRIYKILSKKDKILSALPEKYKVLLDTLQEKGFVKNEDIRHILSIPRHQAKRIAQRLVSLGIFEKEGKGKGTRYKMKQYE